jgi:hypothetical protein
MCAQLVLALEQRGARGQRVGLELAAPDGAAHEDHREDRGPGEDRDAVELRVRAEQPQHVADDEHADARQEARRVRPHGDRVQRTQPRHSLRQGARVAGGDGQHGIAGQHDRARPQRPAAPHRDRRGHEDHERRGQALRAGDAAAQPDLELTRHHEPRRHDAVELLALGEALHRRSR